MTEDERFYASGPEEGDRINQTVLICDEDGTELIELRAGGAGLNMLLGRRIAQLLNWAKAEFV